MQNSDKNEVCGRQAENHTGKECHLPGSDKKGNLLSRTCPVCKRRFKIDCDILADRSQSFYPFCSSKCRMVDLGRWLNADYRFTSPVNQDPDDQDYDDE